MINRAWNWNASFRLISVTAIIPHMIRPYYCCCCITEPFIFRHCVHLNLGHRFHVLLKICFDHDDSILLIVLHCSICKFHSYKLFPIPKWDADFTIFILHVCINYTQNIQQANKLQHLNFENHNNVTQTKCVESCWRKIWHLCFNISSFIRPSKKIKFLVAARFLFHGCLNIILFFNF